MESLVDIMRPTQIAYNMAIAGISDYLEVKNRRPACKLLRWRPNKSSCVMWDGSPINIWATREEREMPLFLSSYKMEIIDVSGDKFKFSLPHQK